MESFGFCPEDVDEGVQVISKTEVSCDSSRKNTWTGARARPGVLNGIYQFEVKVLGDVLLRVGWSSSFTGRNVGMEPYSFGYGGTGMKSSSKKFEKYGEEFVGQDGAIISCLIDRRHPESQTISYCLNGKLLGVAFHLTPSLVQVPLFPSVCGRERWAASFRYRDFSFPSDGYDPLVDALLQVGHAVAVPSATGLCLNDADEGVEVSTDGDIAIGRSGQGKWLGVRGRPGVLRGAYQVDFQLLSECLVRVGWATLTARRALGCDAKSFGFGGTGKKSHAGKFEDFGEAFEGKRGSVVSCLLDRSGDSQAISYYLDGRNLGTAFLVPDAMANEPLFPAICGKGSWKVACHCASLLRPVSGFSPIAHALIVGDAVQGPAGAVLPPSGTCVTSKDHSDVQVGRRVVLHVRSGPWQGWYICHVRGIDDLGCYLEHEEDHFTENIPWSYLGGGKYSMELLPPTAAESKLRRVKDVGKKSNQFLRLADLRVTANGAGLELSTCQAGLFVEKIDAVPGQPDLRRGFAIVAIQEQLLLGLEAEEVECRFAAGLSDGAVAVVGPAQELLAVPFSEICRQAVELLQGVPLRQLPKSTTPLLPTSSMPASAALSQAALQVVDGIAGLELEICDLGYLVNVVEESPGQPKLKPGHAILAIGGKSLVNCSEEELERRFASAFRHGSTFVYGPAADLQVLPPAQLQGMLDMLLTGSLAGTSTV